MLQLWYFLLFKVPPSSLLIFHCSFFYKPYFLGFIIPFLKLIKKIVVCSDVRDEKFIGKQGIFNSASYVIACSPRIAYCIKDKGKFSSGKMSANVFVNNVPIFKDWDDDCSDGDLVE